MELLYLPVQFLLHKISILGFFVRYRKKGKLSQYKNKYRILKNLPQFEARYLDSTLEHLSPSYCLKVLHI